MYVNDDRVDVNDDNHQELNRDTQTIPEFSNKLANILQLNPQTDSEAHTQATTTITQSWNRRRRSICEPIQKLYSHHHRRHHYHH